jgi:hypothetical protein
MTRRRSRAALRSVGETLEPNAMHLRVAPEDLADAETGIRQRVEGEFLLTAVRQDGTRFRAEFLYAAVSDRRLRTLHHEIVLDALDDPVHAALCERSDQDGWIGRRGAAGHDRAVERVEMLIAMYAAVEVGREA